jgi:hypothetical protein
LGGNAADRAGRIMEIDAIFRKLATLKNYLELLP